MQGLQQQFVGGAQGGGFYFQQQQTAWEAQGVEVSRNPFQFAIHFKIQEGNQFDGGAQGGAGARGDAAAAAPEVGQKPFQIHA